MHRSGLILAVALVAGGAAVPLPAAIANGSRRTFHFTDHVSGAQLSADTNVYRDRSSRLGQGAGVQKIRLNGLSGTDREITYYRHATVRSHGHFTLAAPDANGVSTITGRGHITRGTGRFKSVRAAYSVTGSLDIGTGAFRVVLRGTATMR